GRAVADQLDLHLEGRAVAVHGVLLRQGAVHGMAEDGVNGRERRGRLGAHVDLHPALEGDGVDGGPAADAAHVVAGTRAGGGEAGGLLVEEAYGAAEGVDRVRGAERAPGVAAGALEGHAVAAGPERLVGDGIVLAAVDGDERVDAGPALAEQV